mgnify:CR=1 FL=1
MNRKEIPIYSGVIKYFPLAIQELAKVSYAGQQQHNPNKPLAWDRSKSGDELDALMRHLTDHANGVIKDDDGVRHLAKVAWRALAMLQKELEQSESLCAKYDLLIDEYKNYSYVPKEESLLRKDNKRSGMCS